MSTTNPRRTLTLAIASLALAALLAPSAARADRYLAHPDSSFSLGFMLGGPTGLILERDLPSGNAWDAALGLAYGPGIRVHADYLWSIAELRGNPDFFMRFQIGLGGVVGSLTHPCEFYGSFGACDGAGYIGARVPFALELWPRAPLNFGLEIAPVIAINRNEVAGFVDAFLFVRFVL